MGGLRSKIFTPYRIFVVFSHLKKEKNAIYRIVGFIVNILLAIYFVFVVFHVNY